MLEELQPLVRDAVRRKYNTGATILYQGEAPRSACVLLSGILRVMCISAAGDEQIVMFQVAGEFFPMPWIFGKSPSTLFFYEAITDCEVAFVPRQELLNYLYKEESRMRLLLDYYATNYTASMMHINALEQPRARDKLLYTLYYMCQRYGSPDTKKVHIPIKLTHQNLASLVGLTRETTATEMNKLKKQHVINYSNQQYIVDVEQLLDLIGEDSFRGIHIES